MATFTSDKAKSGVSARRLHAGTYVEVCVYSASATMSSGDVIQLCKVQAGERVVGLEVVSPTEPIGIRAGDGLDPNRYLTDVTATTTVNRININTAFNYEYSADDTVDVTYLAGQTANASVQLIAHVWKTSDN